MCDPRAAARRSSIGRSPVNLRPLRTAWVSFPPNRRSIRLRIDPRASERSRGWRGVRLSVRNPESPRSLGMSTRSTALLRRHGCGIRPERTRVGQPLRSARTAGVLRRVQAATEYLRLHPQQRRVVSDRNIDFTAVHSIDDRPAVGSPSHPEAHLRRATIICEARRHDARFRQCKMRPRHYRPFGPPL